MRYDRGGNRLRGSIPPELGNLTELIEIDFRNNDLGGSLPPELGNLSSLESLWLSGNKLSGPIPPELGNLANLTSLYLEGNKLSGQIPPELDNLTLLSTISLYGNPLLGPIPPGIDQLARSNEVRISLMDDRPALEALYHATGGDSWRNSTYWLTDRPLGEWYGVATNRIGRVTKLIMRYDRGGNRLRGPIPPELGNLTELIEIDFRGNELSGSIPPELGNLTKLAELYLTGSHIKSHSILPQLAALIACTLINNDSGVLSCSPD